MLARREVEQIRHKTGWELFAATIPIPAAESLVDWFNPVWCGAAIAVPTSLIR